MARKIDPNAKAVVEVECEDFSCDNTLQVTVPISPDGLILTDRVRLEVSTEGWDYRKSRGYGSDPEYRYTCEECQEDDQ